MIGQNYIHDRVKWKGVCERD